jgi:hypothetical protein
MNLNRIATWSVLLAVLAGAVSGNAWADRRRHSHTSVGIVIGPAFYPSPWYYHPYYDPFPPPIIIERAPPVYIEQPAPYPVPEPQAAAPAYWYYCAASQAYYPYVKACPGGWQRVSPTPPGQP